jgi:hypothetical protein
MNARGASHYVPIRYRSFLLEGCGIRADVHEWRPFFFQRTCARRMRSR